MRELLKKTILVIWPLIYKFLPKIKSVQHFNDKIDMLLLLREDPPLWRVLKARQMGVKVGDRCRFYSCNFFSEPYLVEIGNDVIISGDVNFVTHDGSIYLLKDEIPNLLGLYGKIKIGNNCFIGMGAIILPNVEIGNNCIIGAGAVVTRSFPDNSVIMGNPAQKALTMSMYTKIRKNSPDTIRHDQYPFPKKIPKEIEKELLLKHFKKVLTKIPQNSGD